MKAACILALLATAAAVDVTPVQKVIEMLNGLVAKGEAEKKAEQVQFATYKAWCGTTTTEKQAAIADSNAKIETLQADIQKFEADARDAGDEVAKLDADISTWEGDTVAAGKVREIENIDYTKTHKDYTESIEALQKGIDSLKTQNVDIAQAKLLQLQKVKLITPAASKAIEVFLAQDPSVRDENLAIAEAAPEAAGFESNLQGILDMLSGLAAKFEDERTQLEKAETEAKTAFEMVSMDLKSQIGAATEARTKKSEEKAQSLQMAADAKGDLTDATSTRDDDSKFLADMTATCELKTTAFADRQALRGKELEALQKARDILGGGAVAGAAEKHLPELLQQKAKAKSLAQLRSDAVAPQQQRVASFLKARAQKLNSHVLSMIATRVAADPFKKVKKMVKDLIVKLMEEATEEAETKGFCDMELSTNEHTRKEKTALVESLHAEIDEITASISILTEELGGLAKALSELETAISSATEQRAGEKAKNLATIQDAKDAQEAATQALTVLKEFYDSAADATALVQQPAIFGDEPYTGMGGESGGVLSMIEVIVSDFMRLEAETSAEEEAGAKEYEQFMHDSTLNKAQMNKDVEHKTAKRETQSLALQQKKKDLAGTTKELDAALKYFEKLKPTCLGGTESYEERVAQRKEEIESLKEALRILNGEEV